MKMSSGFAALILSALLQVGWFQLDSYHFYTSNSSIDLNHITANKGAENSDGLLIIIPDMKFEESGSILSWSGLIAVNTSTLTQDLEIDLQVWRPTTGNSFALVGSDHLVLDLMDLIETDSSEETAEESLGWRYYRFEEKEGNSSCGIPVQPGDVVGCFLPAAATGDSDSESVGFVFGNRGTSDEGGRKMLVYSVVGDICDAFRCNDSLILCVISSAIPMIHPEVEVLKFDDENGSGYMECSNLSSCSATRSCDDGSNSDDTECGVNKATVPGLFVVIAAVCIVVVCIIGVTANTLTLCIARHSTWTKDRTLSRANRLEASCPFIVNEQTEMGQAGEENPAQNITSLAEFLQYNMESKLNTESNRMSWV